MPISITVIYQELLIFIILYLMIFISNMPLILVFFNQVTGANQGIGYGIVRRLCKEHPDWTIYGTSRGALNGEEAAKKLQSGGLKAQFLEADLTKPETFAAVKEKLTKDHGGLDILINNAGMAFKVECFHRPYAVKAEVTLATNVFGTNMVCDTLFPILKNGARVVVLSSMRAPMALHKVKKLNPRDTLHLSRTILPDRTEVLQAMTDFVSAVKAGDFAEKGWPDDEAYSVSNLGDTLLARAYQQEFNSVSERDIVVNAVCPGYVSTSMSSHKGHLTIDEGADTPYYLAVLPPNTEIRGQHVCKRQIVKWE
ncbi:hypothetical protein EB796_002150 [Bugula neritina]|uniref:CBR1 n=1 Tax=Bugula neritina TaxID=10212 RepID=A0A7J7KMZ1_BUGNE|nr:hypothetical protein EB796_002150 [Bugula neritina]